MAPQQPTFDSRFENLEKDPVFVRKRRATVACFIVRMFLLGAEYAIILPSIWLYLQQFGAEPWFLGIVVGVYPLAAVISLPVVGYLFDKVKRIKEIILILNGFEIVGNIIYAIPVSPWMIFFGRAIAGLGDGFYACATSEVVHTYPASQRTSILALLEVGRVLGITFGPGLNFFLSSIDFSIGSWKIDYGTAPGLFMALLWILAEVLTVFYTSNLSLLIEERARYFPNIKLDTRGRPPVEYTIDNKRVRETSLCESVLDVEYGDEVPLMSSQKKMCRPFKFYKSTGGQLYIDDELTEEDEFSTDFHESSDFSLSTTHHNNQGEQQEGMIKIVLGLLTPEILSIFFADLILWLAQTEFEVLLPLIGQGDYGWDETQISIVYMVGGVWLMFIFFLIYKFTERLRLKDQHFAVFSLALTISALLFLMCEQIPDEKDIKTRVAFLITVCVFVFTAIPFNLVALKALVAKLTPREKQGIAQGAYSSISRIALIAGPVLAGTAYSHLIVFTILMTVLCIIALIWFVLSLSKIRRKIAEMDLRNG